MTKRITAGVRVFSVLTAAVVVFACAAMTTSADSQIAAAVAEPCDSAAPEQRPPDLLRAAEQQRATEEMAADLAELRRSAEALEVFVDDAAGAPADWDQPPLAEYQADPRPRRPRE